MYKLNILILLHEFAESFEDSHYIVRHLKQIWERRGHAVRAVRGTDQRPGADLLFVHVDATILEDEYLDFISRYPVAINGRVTDISKDRYSMIRLRRNDTYTGPVIVKTLANYGGHQDLYLSHMAGGQPLEQDLHERPWRKVETLDPYDYPVFDSIHAVPPGVWKNPRLLVEKFIGEQNETGHYLMRNWFFLGDQGFTRAVSSPYHIVKPAGDKELPGRETCLHRDDQALHPGLQALRERMGFDYGRFDYVMQNGEPVVFDMNTTPAIFGEGLAMHSKEFLEDLPLGLEVFV